ncbi:MAG TPA: hypothetical protein VHD36_14370 [Pirellulales bacterium]|nr:hypothetical protein [Pirellulales bacterium]
MATTLENPRAILLPLAVGFVAGGAALVAATFLLTFAIAAEPGEMLTRNTVRLSLAWYAAALVLMMRLAPADWRAETYAGQVARWCWTWSIVCFWVHLGVAFHFYHGWSHAHAFEHTREVSGIGEGIYVSYLFTWLWTGDMLWWWARPNGYAARSVWIDRVLHAFMLFIVFNGMVVYESGLIRWAGLAMFAGLAAAWVMARGRPKVRAA